MTQFFVQTTTFGSRPNKFTNQFLTLQFACLCVQQGCFTGFAAHFEKCHNDSLMFLIYSTHLTYAIHYRCVTSLSQDQSNYSTYYCTRSAKCYTRQRSATCHLYIFEHSFKEVLALELFCLRICSVKFSP